MCSGRLHNTPCVPGRRAAFNACLAGGLRSLRVGQGSLGVAAQVPSSQNQGFKPKDPNSEAPKPKSEHKIGIFVRFWPSEPPFSGVSSTKSGFLCAFGLRNPHFRAFRAQNRGFCALLGSGIPVFGHFEHKIGLFVLGQREKWHREA